MALFGDACRTETDKEGRIVLPGPLAMPRRTHGECRFSSAPNKTFQIWEPAAGAKRLADAREKVRAAQLTLRTVPA